MDWAVAKPASAIAVKELIAFIAEMLLSTLIRNVGGGGQ